MTVRELTSDDAPAVAGLHLATLRGLLHDLGEGVLTAFYRAAVRLPETVAAVADEDGRVLGFVFGTTEADGFYPKVFRSAAVGIGARVALALAWRPSLARHLRKATAGAEAEVRVHGSTAELMFLAVADCARGRGVGRALVGAFDTDLAARGVTGYHLSVEADNEAAIGFYERLGLTREATFEEFGLLRHRYLRELAP